MCWYLEFMLGLTSGARGSNTTPAYSSFCLFSYWASKNLLTDLSLMVVSTSVGPRWSWHPTLSLSAVKVQKRLDLYLATPFLDADSPDCVPGRLGEDKDKVRALYGRPRVPHVRLGASQANIVRCGLVRPFAARLLIMLHCSQLTYKYSEFSGKTYLAYVVLFFLF
ncbi:hypothetical protein BV20DRAFT_961999 [Pilatotrama ljubarskyi]|nr:hypothetical protein BV20DRAFT_961999 [Pilatotrama ljubarskyi]